MSRRRPSFVALVLAFVLVAGCTDSDQHDDPGDARAACAPADDERPAKAILRCTEDSVALVETEVASGTGMVVELDAQSYVLTNAHVVDPFDAADVTFGEVSYDDLPIVGIDASADIALLGPLTGPDVPEPVVVADGTDLERGDDLFLVGYPGTTDEDDLEVTIASGIVSRIRVGKEFEQLYIQTDAAIAGGQSGGPLFDAAGRVVGVSGLSFSEEFALALSGRNVLDAANRIVAGDGDPYQALPARADRAKGQSSGTLHLSEATDAQVLFLPRADEDRTWHLKIGTDHDVTAVVVNPLDSQPMAISGTADALFDRLTKEMSDAGFSADDVAAPDEGGVDQEVRSRETAPGEFTIPVAAHASALVL